VAGIHLSDPNLRVNIATYPLLQELSDTCTPKRRLLAGRQKEKSQIKLKHLVL